MRILNLDYKYDGEIYVDGISSEIYTRGHWSHFQRKLERMLGTVVKDAIYEWYKRGAKEAMGIYTVKNIDIFRIANKRMIAEQMLEQMHNFGYGEPRIISFDDEKGVLIEVKNSFNAVGYAKTKHCVCYALSGTLAGGAEMLFGKSMESEEIQCRARGDGHCRFKIFTSPRNRKLGNKNEGRADTESQ